MLLSNCALDAAPVYGRPAVFDGRQVALRLDGPRVRIGIVARVVGGDLEEDGIGTFLFVGGAHGLTQGAVPGR